MPQAGNPARRASLSLLRHASAARCSRGRCMHVASARRARAHRAMTSKNKVLKSYIGMGYYNTYLPPVIQ